MTNAKQVVLATLRELLKQWEKEHDYLLKKANEQLRLISNEELAQLEAVLLNLNRLHGLIMWIEQNEKIK
jgi:hypothetical protein